MFERDEVLKELHARLVGVGINPLDSKVQAIWSMIGRTAAICTSAYASTPWGLS